MTYLKTLWAYTKKTLRFLWRHLLTLAVLAILITVIMESQLNWENAFYMVATSLVLDWVKMFIRFTPYAGHFHRTGTDPDDMGTPINRRQYWNPSVPGSLASYVDTMGGNRHY